MIVPCIDLMGGKVVQLVQGREKALEGDPPTRCLRKFAAFPEIQVIDLDAAMGNAAPTMNWCEHIASPAAMRVGGGVRNAERARKLVSQGVAQGNHRHGGVHARWHQHAFLAELQAAIGRERVLIALDSKGGRIVVKGWREATDLTAEEVPARWSRTARGFLCTYVDKEGMLQGTDLDWFRRLRAATTLELSPPPAASRPLKKSRSCST